MEKLRFEFAVKALESDNKTNVITITSVETDKNEIFVIPKEFQNISLHEKLKNLATFQKVKSTLTRRGNSRRVWLTLDEEALKVYKDDDGNMHFNNYLLEQVDNTKVEKNQKETSISTETLQQILEKLSTTTSEKESDKQNIKNISDKIVIEKFTGKNANVLQWMEIFESECLRLKIDQDINKIEILRLFLEGSCIDWYSSMLIKHTINSDWEQWKKIFCETYADKGWTPVRYAIEYKYVNGYLLEYALKKERMLLEVNKSLDKKILIDLIAVGLPNFICDRIDRNKLTETNDLFNELRGLEHLVRRTAEKKEKGYSEKKTRYAEIKKPCKICREQKKGERYHPESNCWFRNKNEVKTVNNSELEVELNENNQKN